jgi:hypothetical protein
VEQLYDQYQASQGKSTKGVKEGIDSHENSNTEKIKVEIKEETPVKEEELVDERPLNIKQESGDVKIDLQVGVKYEPVNTTGEQVEIRKEDIPTKQEIREETQPL